MSEHLTNVHIKGSDGFNTQVTVDGIPLRGVISVSWKVSTQEMGVAVIECYADVDILTGGIIKRGEPAFGERTK